MAYLKIYIIIYGLFLLSGAYFGKKAGSKISMIMGLASGALVFLFLFIHAQSPVIGRWGLYILSLGLSFVFLKRFIVTKKFMPAGLLLVASVIALIVSLNLNS